MKKILIFGSLFCFVFISDCPREAGKIHRAVTLTHRITPTIAMRLLDALTSTMCILQ